tara:strand:- start:438 stop:1259 length:822 start_codon:yes stop_codon:yes gene_type:complete
MLRNCLIISTLMLLSLSAHAEPRFHTVNHGIYISTMDCQTRLPVAVQYKVGKDTGNASRYSSYINDETLLAEAPQCHPLTAHSFRTYQAVLKRNEIAQSYDVGHLAASNHLDNSAMSSKIANQFSNLAPQASGFNRRGGAYFQTESIIECHRDIEPLLVVAGTLDDPNTTDYDFFSSTFGQTTPDYWYRVVYWSETNVYKAWLMPNSPSATDDNLLQGRYDVGLEALVENLPVQLEFFESLINSGVPEATTDFIETKLTGKTLRCRNRTTGIG